MTKFLNEVKAYEKASKKAGKFGKEEKEWAEEQVEFFGMRSHMLMMRGGDDGEIDQQQYRDAIKHKKEMEPLVDPTYIGTQWSFIGPRGLDGSTSCQFGPVTGRVNTVAYSHQDPNNDFWVGGATGGVFKTANNGGTFVAESDTWDTTYCSKIAIDRNNANRVYVATGDYPGWWGYGIGLMRTSNGTSWTIELATELAGCEVSDILVDPDDSSTIIASAGRGTDNSAGKGLWRSTDYGDTWVKVQSTSITGGFCKLSAGITSGGVRRIYASTGDGGIVRRSSDGGATWVDVSPLGFSLCSVAASKTHRDVVYCYSSAGDIFKSTDAGNNWKTIKGNLGNITGVGADFRQVTYNYMFDVINTSAAGTGSDILLFGAVDCFALVDPIGGNTTWNWINGDPGETRLIHADYHGIDQHPTLKNTCLIANDGGVWQMSFSAGLYFWSNKNHNLRLTEHVFTAPHPDASNFPNYVNTGMWHIGCGWSPNDVNDWRSNYGKDGMWTSIDDANPNIQYVSGQNLGANSSIDLKGTSTAWSTSATLSTPTSITDENWAFASPWDEIPGDTGALYMAGERLYKLKWTGGSATWTKSIGGADLSASSDEYVTAIEAVTSAGCFVGTNYGRLQGSFTPTTGMPLLYDFPGGISSINASAADPDDLLVSLGGVDRGPNYNGALYEVLDATSTSRIVIDRSGTGSNALPNIGVNWVERDPYDPQNTWYAATDLGVYYTRSRGVTWYNISESMGLPNALVYHLETSDNILYASTFGRGIWRMTLYTSNPITTAFTFQGAEVTGGNDAPATMTLSREAPPGGLDIPVTSNNLAAIPTQTVHFPAGFTTATVQVRTDVVTASSTVTATANLGGAVSDSIIVRECIVNGMYIEDVTAGNSFSGAVFIDRAAPKGGIVVNFADNDPGTTINSPVTIPQGETFTLFTGDTNLEPFNRVVSVQASGPGSGWQQDFTKLGVRVLSAVVTPDPVWNTQGSGILVTLNRAAPVGGFPLTIVSGIPTVATAPPSWAVPGGLVSRSVPITTYYTPIDRTAGFRVWDPYQGYIEDALFVKHLGFATFSFNPDPVIGGLNSTGTITLDRTVDEVIPLGLHSADPSLVDVPRTVFTQVNSNLVVFTAATTAVNSVTDVDLDILLGSSVQNGTTLIESLRLLPSQVVVVPASFTVNLGRVNSGNVSSLAFDDGNVLRVCKFLVPNQQVAPVTVQIDGTSSQAVASALRLEFRSRMQSAGSFGLTLDLWNWSTNNWDTTNVLTTSVNTTFSLSTLNTQGAISQFLRGSDGALKARYRVKQTGPSVANLWCHETDRANWIVTP